MAGTSGFSGTPLISQRAEKAIPPAFQAMATLLEQEPFRVQFFQAVRMLQRMDGQGTPVGHFSPAANEAVRFSSLPSLSFPPSELYSIERDENDQLCMTVQFMGLCAAISVLPEPFTELVLQRLQQKDRAMADFFDIFNHRLISFFYRGWEKYRFFIGYEHGGEDRISPRLKDLLGLGLGSPVAGLSPEAYLAYTGQLARHVRTAASLQAILEEYFGVPVAVQQFVGTWRKLQKSNQTCFSGLGGPTETLGMGVVAGDEVWDVQGRIRVSVGPMSFERYLEFLPGKAAAKELCAWLRFYSNRAWETEVQLILDRAEAPPCLLGDQTQTRPQLGYVSWIQSRPQLGSISSPNSKLLSADPGDATYLVTG